MSNNLIKSQREQLAAALRREHWQDGVPSVITNYVSWLATSPEAREPETIEEFADSEGVSVRALYKLESHARFVELLQPFNNRGTGGISRLAVRLALEELERQASKPGADLRAIQLLLQQAGALTPVVSVRGNFQTTSDKELNEMTMEELLSALAETGATDRELDEAESAV
jgi:hypothetical protein